MQIIAVPKKPKNPFGALNGTFKIVGDIVGPLGEEYDEDREWRKITGQFDDPSARYAHCHMDGGGPVGPRKERMTGVQRRPRGK
ncbi:MAG: hypothetical protein KIS73_10870 [Enhydrobacter sp.]|nr:hypothetical protein [Enhydrobacter sp.]